MTTLNYTVGNAQIKSIVLYGDWGERRLPQIKSKSELYSLLATELGLSDSEISKGYRLCVNGQVLEWFQMG